MFCRKCGQELRQNAKFCSRCGVNVDAAPAQPVIHVPESPPLEKKSKKLLVFGITGVAVALFAIAFILFALPMLQKDKNIDVVTQYDDDDDEEVIHITINVQPPGERKTDFDAGEVNFTSNDPSIKMIEVNQGLSYGFDAHTGNFYLLENFVAGKETAIFIDLDKPLDPKADVMLVIERNGEPLATLLSVDIIDDTILLFHPRDMAEVDYWEQGIYTFTFIMDDSIAERTVNFHKATPMKVLAVPVKGNYTGDIRTCGDEWKLGATMLTAVFPVAREDVEYILGPEQDLSGREYDLNSKDGRKNVWKALCALQTPNNDYTMIIGFMATPTMEGYLGYTYGGEATIVSESEPDLLATVVHEIAHCYKIGDEYLDGSLNDFLNPPPYGMKGHDILTGEPAEGTKEHVMSGDTVGLLSSGSVIYPQQRAYWHEGRELLGTITSYMSSGTGEHWQMFWTSSDIWNHLFKVFTGQLTGTDTDYGATPGDDAQLKGEYWGQCFECFGETYDPGGYIECIGCAKMVAITGDSFNCSDCGAAYFENDVDENDLWIYHDQCKYLLNYPKFVEHNLSDSNRTSEDELTVLEIRGSFDKTGVFIPEPWYSYKASITTLTRNRDGEYSASVFDGSGARLSIAYFDVKDNYQINTREGYKWGEGDEEIDIPIRVVVKFPENASKVVIHKGNQEIYTENLSANTPTVTFTNLSEGQILTNDTTFTWEANDADGDDLTFQIWYYRSIEEMYMVATDLTGTSYAANLTDYPGGDQGWFVILATDGGLTGTGESPKVSVPFKAPDILNVIPEGKQFKVTDPVEIIGKVYDAQDGWIWMHGYEWYVDGRRYQPDYKDLYFYHTPYMLIPGTHTITMKVTNSAGISSSKDFTIEIIEDESDIPDNWPRNDITLALRLGYYQPLHRLDSPITRLEFAKLVSGIHPLPEDLPDDWVIPHPDDVLYIITDMNGDPYDIEFMRLYVTVSIGLMGLKNATYEYIEELDLTVVTGEFDPYGTLTEREAMQIMFMTIELTRTQTYTTFEVLDESVFIPHMEEWGVLDEAGSFNSYNADERMSKGMSMVRIARYLRYVHELGDKDYGIDAGYFDNFYDD